MKTDDKTNIDNATSTNDRLITQQETGPAGGAHTAQAKIWVLVVLVVTVIGLLLFALPTIIIDPLFHYHAPLSAWEYRIFDEWYQNDGMVKHFSYDAIITGTSMSENFKASQFDKLWNANTIKVPFSGGGFKEIGENLKRAVSANDRIRYIVWSLDGYALGWDKDWEKFDSYPEYLYDNDLLNDVQYALNKELLLKYTYQGVIEYTGSGKVTTSFDEYGNWMKGKVFGRDAILVDGVDENLYVYSGTRIAPKPFTDEDRRVVRETVQQNILPLIRENPQITFYLFFPPYSICYFDSLLSNGDLDIFIHQMEYAAELLLAYDNVRLFSFYDEYDVICDLSNYKDSGHYHEDINARMLVWMRKNEHRLMTNTYKLHFADIRDYYSNFDYETALTVKRANTKTDN